MSVKVIDTLVSIVWTHFCLDPDCLGQKYINCRMRIGIQTIVCTEESVNESVNESNTLAFRFQFDVGEGFTLYSRMLGQLQGEPPI